MYQADTIIESLSGGAPAPSQPTANAVRLRPTGEVPSAAATIEPMVVQPDGRFDFAGVPPGTYVLSVWLSGVPAPMGGPSGVALQLAGGRGGQQMQQVNMESIVWGQTTVVVGDADVSGVVVNLRRAPKVTAKVELPADLAERQQQAVSSGVPSPAQAAAQRAAPIQFMRLTPISLDIRGGGQIARADPSGAFAMTTAGPGQYTIDIGLSLPLQIAKVTLGGVDVTDLPIEIGDADIADVVVSVVTPQRTMISGTVTGAGPDTTVVIFPADQRLWAEPAAARRWFTTAAVDKAGKFSTPSTLVPGNYFVAAIPDEQVIDWIVQSRLQKLAAQAQKVTVAPGETKTIEVKR